MFSNKIGDRRSLIPIVSSNRPEQFNLLPVGGGGGVEVGGSGVWIEGGGDTHTQNHFP